MTISPKAIEALINIEQGLQQARDLVDDLQMRAWTIENKEKIMQSLKKGGLVEGDEIVNLDRGYPMLKQREESLSEHVKVVRNGDQVTVVVNKPQTANWE